MIQIEQTSCPHKSYVPRGLFLRCTTCCVYC